MDQAEAAEKIVAALQKKKTKTKKHLPSEILMIIQFHDEFSYYKDDCRIYHSVQPESLYFKILYETSE